MPPEARSVTSTVFYRTLNVEGLEIFRKHQPPTLITWVKNDGIFTVGGAELIERDIPGAELNTELPGRTRLARWKLLRVFDFTERNLGGSIRAADLANVASLSVSHFTRAFRRSVGITPRVFVLERRIARAKALMMSTQDSLSSIAFACGLTDQSHFTRRFRQVVGLTPKRWRRQQRSAVPAPITGS